MSAVKVLFGFLQGQVSVKLIHMHDHLLNLYDRQIAQYATQSFQRQGIELVLNNMVSSACLPANPWLGILHSSCSNIGRLTCGSHA